MAHDWPVLPDLITTIREFVTSVVPKLEGMDHYHALCTLYLLDVARREITREWRHEETADDRHLRALAGLGPEVPAQELTAQLAAQIRAGRFDDRMPALHDALLEHVIAKVRVSKPSQLIPEHRDD